ncbi:hypothetical protein [Scytonema hofmannii]|uniref:hypothetical protein n=1 Tax=Scytonema hofmannii TaxID=34078 RepID=UPI000345230A|nr:hypothetical protein [Scytonema hofmannii]
MIVNATGTIRADGGNKNEATGIFNDVEKTGVGNAGGIEINTNNLSLLNNTQLSVVL